ncbi:MAG: hypothetical protein ACO3JL_03360 [Myxococcota bacterium]
MEPALGYLLVCLVTLAAAGAATVVHFLTRRVNGSPFRASDALREFEPRGGRQRFSVRLYEAALLGAIWLTCLGVPAASPMPRGTATLAQLCLFVAPVGVASLVTWWLWRRGALRSPRAPKAQLREENDL